MSEKRKISQETYLQALACFITAGDFYLKMRSFELLMTERLGLGDDMGHFSDAIYNLTGNATVSEFKEAMKKSDIELENDK